MSVKHPPPWGRTRGYVHFDGPLTESEAMALVQDPIAIASRAFWPLISFRTIERRWKKGLKQWKSKSRPIAYASHADSHIFSYYSWKLSAPYELLLQSLGLSDVVLAYRKIPLHASDGGRGKANFHFAAEAFAQISLMGECDAVAIDIEKFFDRIPHCILEQNWARLLGKDSLPPDHAAVFKAATEFATVPLLQVRKAMGMGKRRYKKLRSVAMSSSDFDEKIRRRGIIDVNRKGFGIPQGLPISGLLANLVMIEVDRCMSEAAATLGGSYRRYSDDILLIVPPGKGVLLEELLRSQLCSLGLTFQSEKTLRSDFRRDSTGRLFVSLPLQYLGFEFDGERVLVRMSTLVRFGKRMKRAVKRAARSAEKSIRKGGTARIRRRDLYARYSHLLPHPETPKNRRPKGSFMGYVRKASAAVSFHAAVADFEDQIRRQFRGHWDLLQRLIKEAEDSLPHKK